MRTFSVCVYVLILAAAATARPSNQTHPRTLATPAVLKTPLPKKTLPYAPTTATQTPLPKKTLPDAPTTATPHPKKTLPDARTIELTQTPRFLPDGRTIELTHTTLPDGRTIETTQTPRFLPDGRTIETHTQGTTDLFYITASATSTGAEEQTADGGAVVENTTPHPSASGTGVWIYGVALCAILAVAVIAVVVSPRRRVVRNHHYELFHDAAGTERESGV